MWRLRCTETTHKYLLQECVTFKERSAKEYNSISTHSHNSYCIYMHTNKHIFVKVGEHFYTYTVTHRGTPCTEHYFPSQSCRLYFVCRSPLCSSLPATFLQAGGLSDTSVPLCNQKKKKKTEAILCLLSTAALLHCSGTQALLQHNDPCKILV